MKYDPATAPDPDKWLSTDDGERIAFVIAYHKRTKVGLPNVRQHSTLHLIVENQIASGMKEVVEALDRLLLGGLDRHDAIHAIASVFAKHLYNMAKGEVDMSSPNEPYLKELRVLTADSWTKEAR
jgi:hypothetical protein